MRKLSGTMEMCCVLIAVFVTQLYAFIRTHKMAHFLYVYFIMYKLYLKSVKKNIQKVQIVQGINAQSNIFYKMKSIRNISNVSCYLNCTNFFTTYISHDLEYQNTECFSSYYQTSGGKVLLQKWNTIGKKTCFFQNIFLKR